MFEKLTSEQVEIVNAAVRSRLLREPATANELVSVGRSAVGSLPGDPVYRHVDRWLQRYRKRELVTFVRSGKRILWSPTPAGRSPDALA